MSNAVRTPDLDGVADEPAGRSGRAAPPRRPDSRLSTGAKRTLLALLASGLAIVPLRALFSDNSWMIDVWVTMVIVVAPAAVIRLRRSPGALDIWPGIVLLVPWLTLRYLADTAVLGMIPTGRTVDQLSALMTELHDTTRQEVAPIHSTVAVRLVLCALVGLLAALVDLIAVVGRRGALAGVPLLIVFTVAGAVPRKPVSWLWFAVAAIGFLILLSLDAGDDLDHWGRRVKTSGGHRGRTALSVAAPRIAAAAVVAAVVLPLLVPGSGRNLLANAFHGGSGDGLGGFGGGSGGTISPFAALKGQLSRDKPVKLADVHVTASGTDTPFYLRVNVLSDYTGRGWQVGQHGDTIDGETEGYPTTPSIDGPGGDTTNFTAEISAVRRLNNPAVFDRPTRFTGLGSDATWSPQDQIMLGTDVGEGDRYTEEFEQPSPSSEQLRSASRRIDPEVRSQLAVPDDLPAYVKNLVRTTIQGQDTQFDRARAIFKYFSEDNGFSYNLATQESNSGSDLVAFLQNRQGYCQQYAAAMAIMLRQAGVPGRVVLGYTHDKPDRNGDFSITTNNAHAWVEAWFAGIGWIPFDPTPAGTGGTGGRDQLPYAPKSSTAPSQSLPAGSSTTAAPSSSRATSAASSSAAQPQSQTDQDSGPGLTPIWLGGGILVVLGLALAPSATRWSRRRRRVADGDPDALWAELSDTAVDLGYVWSSARTPRQVASWLADDAAGAAGSLRTLAAAVEHRRYGPHQAPGEKAELRSDLRAVTGQLWSRRSGRNRLRARLLPASLGGWTGIFGRGRHLD